MNTPLTLPSSVLALHICPGHRRPMHRVDDVMAYTDKGLHGDLHAIAGSSRQVLLIEHETLIALGLDPGIVKENITTIGIPLMTLRSGTHLRIGAETVLELTKPCVPCGRMDEIRPGLQKDIAGRRGMLARVVRGGTIRRGDQIAVIDGAV